MGPPSEIAAEMRESIISALEACDLTTHHGNATTIRILLGLLFPGTGTATILGRDLVREPREAR